MSTKYLIIYGALTADTNLNQTKEANILIYINNLNDKFSRFTAVLTNRLLKIFLIGY